MDIDRRSGNRGSIHLPNASVSVTGGIPPETLASRLTRAQLTTGLFARLLFAFPPAQRRHAPQRTDVSQVTRAYSDVFEKLLKLPYGLLPGPVMVRETVELSPEAQQRFDQFVEEFGEEQAQADPSLAASFAKLEGYAVRFALILHLARWASSEDVPPEVCDLVSIEQGITLSRWFANEARRVRALLSETPDDADQRKLIGWLNRRGGQATARDLVRSGNRRYVSVDEARTALNRLAETSQGVWVDRSSADLGRRPHQVFVLSDGRSAEGSFVGYETLCLSGSNGEDD